MAVRYLVIFLDMDPEGMAILSVSNVFFFDNFSILNYRIPDCQETQNLNLCIYGLG